MNAVLESKKSQLHQYFVAEKLLLTSKLDGLTGVIQMMEAGMIVQEGYRESMPGLDFSKYFNGVSFMPEALSKLYCRRYYDFTAERIDDLIEEAPHHIYAYEALRKLCMYFSTFDKPFPPKLKMWHHQMLAGNVKRPRVSEESLVNIGRDHVIRKGIELLVDDDLPVTRNDATDEKSACSLVSDTLRYFGLHLEPGSIKKIWNQRNH